MRTKLPIYALVLLWMMLCRSASAHSPMSGVAAFTVIAGMALIASGFLTRVIVRRGLKGKPKWEQVVIGSAVAVALFLVLFQVIGTFIFVPLYVLLGG